MEMCVCGNPIYRTGKNQKYCTVKCQRKHNRLKNVEKRKAYMKEWQRNRNPIGIVPCLNCTELFDQTNSKHVFCSHICCNKYQRIMNPEREKAYHMLKYLRNRNNILEYQKEYAKNNREKRRKSRYEYYLKNRNALHKQRRILYHTGIHIPLKLCIGIQDDFYTGVEKNGN